jgi:hypothetical protein
VDSHKNFSEDSWCPERDSAVVQAVYRRSLFAETMIHSQTSQYVI